MRTTLDLPDDILKQARIEAVERGSTLRQLIIDALQKEMSAAGRPRKRHTQPPIKLAADAPLRHLSPEAVKQLDNEAGQQHDESKMLWPVMPNGKVIVRVKSRSLLDLEGSLKADVHVAIDEMRPSRGSH